jgi:diguanylate cyclase (GGDEF)-like protein
MSFSDPAPPVVPTILIVDDDRLNRMALAELLQDDHRILLAGDGESALAQLEKAEVDLVLLDVSMPGMDGFEVLARLRQQERTVSVPVIFITGKTEEAEEERGLLLGAADYVNKPIRGAVVRARVRAHLALSQQRKELESYARQDGLTGIANRRALDEATERAISQLQRSGEPLAIAIFDVDCFKQYNDHYGHAAGDDVLRQVAAQLASLARRKGDLIARYGGEEFSLLMPGCTDFAPVLEQARQLIATAAIPHERSVVNPSLTISGGGILTRVNSTTTLRFLYEAADRMLYKAKTDGRNRVRLHMAIDASQDPPD